MNWKALDITHGKTVITTIDAHTAGEPLRIIVSGFPELKGDTILARRRHIKAQYDHLRTALMHEPRGHYDMYGCLVTPPATPEADIGVLFMHNEGYSTMCGHGIIAVVTALIETGALPRRGLQTPVAIDSPAGLIRATAHAEDNGRVSHVSFVNVASFLYGRELAVELPGFGKIKLDIAFGGAFYAILPAAAIGLRVGAEHRKALVAAARQIKSVVNETHPIRHPFEEDLGFLYGVIFTDDAEDPAHHSRNLCEFANSEVDRSPTGTGVGARLALHYAKGELKLNETIAIESILGKRSVFQGRVLEETRVGPHEAVIPEVSGSAYITGRHEFIIDPNDPLAHGFLL